MFEPLWLIVVIGETRNSHSVLVGEHNLEGQFAGHGRRSEDSINMHVIDKQAAKFRIVVFRLRIISVGKL